MPRSAKSITSSRVTCSLAMSAAAPPMVPREQPPYSRQAAETSRERLPFASMTSEAPAFMNGRTYGSMRCAVVGPKLPITCREESGRGRRSTRRCRGGTRAGCRIRAACGRTGRGRRRAPPPSAGQEDERAGLQPRELVTHLVHPNAKVHALRRAGDALENSSGPGQEPRRVAVQLLEPRAVRVDTREALRCALQETPTETGRLAAWRGRRITLASRARNAPPN